MSWRNANDENTKERAESKLPRDLCGQNWSKIAEAEDENLCIPVKTLEMGGFLLSKSKSKCSMEQKKASDGWSKRAVDTASQVSSRATAVVEAAVAIASLWLVPVAPKI